MKKTIILASIISIFTASVATAAVNKFILELPDGSVQRVKGTLLDDKEVYKLVDGKNTCYLAYSKNGVNIQAGVAISCVK